MYVNVNTNAFRDIPSVSALLSLSEMLFQKNPNISSVFINYASKLVQNQLARTGSSPERDAAFATLQGLAQQMKLPPPKTVETFANSLVASASGQYANDFYQIAYLAYCSLSIYGPLSNSIQTRIANVQGKISGVSNQQQFSGQPQFNQSFPGGSADGPPKFTPYNGAPPSFNPASAGGPPSFTPQGGPPSFTPQGPPSFNATSSGGPPVFTPQGGPPSFTPQGGPPSFTPQGGPPQFTPQGGPPVFTPAGSPPSFTPSGGPPAFNPNAGYPQQKSQISDKARKLMELAHSAFKAGSLAVAYSALNGAINELQK